jgi:Icc-related predicted phosphoesterase
MSAMVTPLSSLFISDLIHESHQQTLELAHDFKFHFILILGYIIKGVILDLEGFDEGSDS